MWVAITDSFQKMLVALFSAFNAILAQAHRSIQLVWNQNTCFGSMSKKWKPLDQYDNQSMPRGKFSICVDRKRSNVLMLCPQWAIIKLNWQHNGSASKTLGRWLRYLGLAMPLSTMNQPTQPCLLLAHYPLHVRSILWILSTNPEVFNCGYPYTLGVWAGSLYN